MHTVVSQTSISTHGQGHKQTFIYSGAGDYMEQTVLCHFVAAHEHFRTVRVHTELWWAWQINRLWNICTSHPDKYLRILVCLSVCLSPLLFLLLLLLPSSPLPQAQVSDQLSKQMLCSQRLCNESRQVLSDIISSQHLRKLFPPAADFMLQRSILWISVSVQWIINTRVSWANQQKAASSASLLDN